MSDLVLVLPLSPYAFRPNPPKLPLRITACGFTNLQRGHGGCACRRQESKRRERELQVGRRDRLALAQVVAPLPSATDVTARGWTEPQATSNARSDA